MKRAVVKRRRTFRGLASWFDDMDVWFDYDFSTRPVEKNWLPPIDIAEQDGTYLVKADLPGLKREDIHLELQDGYLTLKGERKG